MDCAYIHNVRRFNPTFVINMSHFALVINGVVSNVIVAEQEFIDSGLVGDPSQWIQTSYNTRGGVHYGADGAPDGGAPLRKNYAGVGYSYDESRDAFIPPKPYPSWLLDEEKCLWVAPIPFPELSENQSAYWDEATTSWVIEEIQQAN